MWRSTTGSAKYPIPASEEAGAGWKASLHENAQPLTKKLPMDCLVGRRTDHPRRQLQDSTPSNPLLSQDQEPPGLHLLDLEKPSLLRNLDRPRSKEEDGDENDKGNDAMLRHSSDTGSVHPSTLTPAGSFLNLAHVKPDSPRLREKITRAAGGVAARRRSRTHAQRIRRRNSSSPWSAALYR